MKWIALFFIPISFALAEECRPVEGYASWYGGKFHGRRASSGERFDKHKFTAASKQFSMHSYVLVKNLENGKEVVVRINDRGPYKKGRIIDLSKSAAQKLEMIEKGVVRVQVLPLSCVSKDNPEEIIADIIRTD